MLKSKDNVCNNKKEQGFTLIELSIVLVIIGLIVGGVLVGQDLIKAAEQRATITQIEKYNTAVRTFQGKFGGIPGDLAWATANTFGLGIAGGTMTAGGDGNGVLVDGQGTNYNTPTGEIVLFWQQLTQAGLLDGNLGNATTVVSLAGASVIATTASYFPLAKLGRGNYITVGSGTDGVNYYGISGVNSAITAGAAGTATYGTGTNNLTPLESYNIDKKVDDGMPYTGNVQARNGTYGNSISTSMIGTLSTSNGGTAAAAYASAACTTGNATVGTLTNTYQVSTFGTTPSCALQLKMQ